MGRNDLHFHDRGEGIVQTTNAYGAAKAEVVQDPQDRKACGGSALPPAHCFC